MISIPIQAMGKSGGRKRSYCKLHPKTSRYNNTIYSKFDPEIYTGKKGYNICIINII